MTFDVGCRSSDILTPVHNFPGDENVSPDEDRRSIFGGYLSSASTLLGGADAFGLDVDAETFERWKRVTSAAGKLDTFLDTSTDHRLAYDDYMRVLERSSSDAPIDSFGIDANSLNHPILLLQNSVRVLPEGKIDRLHAAARTIGSCALVKAECDDIDEYIKIMIIEGRSTSDLITQSASEELSSQGQFPRFEAWCSNAFQLATLVDGARDLWADSRKGRTNVRPTIPNCYRITRRAQSISIKLHNPDIERRATIQAFRRRLDFSLLPTRLTTAIYSKR